MLVCEFDLPLGCGLGMSLAFIVQQDRKLHIPIL